MTPLPETMAASGVPSRLSRARSSVGQGVDLDERSDRLEEAQLGAVLAASEAEAPSALAAPPLQQAALALGGPALGGPAPGGPAPTAPAATAPSDALPAPALAAHAPPVTAPLFSLAASALGEPDDLDQKQIMQAKKLIMQDKLPGGAQYLAHRLLGADKANRDGIPIN